MTTGCPHQPRSCDANASLATLFSTLLRMVVLGARDGIGLRSCLILKPPFPWPPPSNINSRVSFSRDRACLPHVTRHLSHNLHRSAGRQAAAAFSVGPDHSWVRHTVSAVGDGAAHCRAGAICSFRLVVQPPGPARPHSFRVRLIGPAILMGRVSPESPTSYLVSYSPLVSPPRPISLESAADGPSLICFWEREKAFCSENTHARMATWGTSPYRYSI